MNGERRARTQESPPRVKIKTKQQVFFLADASGRGMLTSMSPWKIVGGRRDFEEDAWVCRGAQAVGSHKLLRRAGLVEGMIHYRARMVRDNFWVANGCCGLNI